MTNVICGCTMTALFYPIHNMKPCKTQTVLGFVQNVISSIFLTLFFDEQLNLESENRFNPLGNSDKTKSSARSTLTSKSKFIGGLKFFSININSIRGKKLELLAFINMRVRLDACTTGFSPPVILYY